MKWLAWGIVILVVLLIVLSAAGFFSAGVPVESAAVERGTIREFVDEQGKTRLPHTHLITMPFDGRVAGVTLKENDPVTKDQVVAEIVRKDLDDALEEAQAAVDRLQAAVKESKDKSVESTSEKQSWKFVESMLATVKSGENRLTASKKRLDYAEQNLQRVRKLHERNAASQDELERADVQMVEAEVSYKQDELVLASIQAIKAATDLMPVMIGQYASRKDLTTAVLEKQKEEAQARLKQVLTNRERGVMRSPVEGVVLERMESNERRMPGGTVLLKIGQLEQLEIEADILSQDVVNVKNGLAAEIYGPAVGATVGEGARAEVRRVFPAGFTKVSSLGVEQQRVKVVLGFADGVLDRLRVERGLGVDYRVRVRIFTAEKEDALIVPRSAIFRGPDGGWQVFAIVAGRARLTPVKVGLMNDERVEIALGLAKGDRVVLAPESTLTDGARVRSLISR